VKEVVAVALVIIIAVLTDVALLLIARILPKRKPTDLKYMRWEAGNIPLATPKYVLPMQYYGYLILFMALEPVAVLFMLIAVYPAYAIQLFALSAIIIAPAVYYAFYQAYELAERRDFYG